MVDISKDLQDRLDVNIAKTRDELDKTLKGHGLSENEKMMISQVLALMNSPELCLLLLQDMEDAMQGLLKQAKKKQPQFIRQDYTTIPHGYDKGTVIPVTGEKSSAQENFMWAMEVVLQKNENKYGWNMGGAPTTIGLIQSKDFLGLLSKKQIPKESTKAFADSLYHGKQTHRLQLWIVRKALKMGLITFYRTDEHREKEALEPRDGFDRFMDTIVRNNESGDFFWNLLFDTLGSYLAPQEREQGLFCVAANVNAQIMQSEQLPCLSSVVNCQYRRTAEKMYNGLLEKGNEVVVQSVIKVGRVMAKSEGVKINDDVALFSIGLSALNPREGEGSELTRKYGVDVTALRRSIGWELESAAESGYRAKGNLGDKTKAAIKGFSSNLGGGGGLALSKIIVKMRLTTLAIMKQRAELAHLARKPIEPEKAELRKFIAPSSHHPSKALSLSYLMRRHCIKIRQIHRVALV